MKKLQRTLGFTLIELLVVMSVIALILAVSMPNFLGARQRARDSQKKAALNQIKTALRLYYNDYNKYPADNSPGPQYKLIKGCGLLGTSSCLPGCAYGDFSAGGSGSDCNNASTVYMKKLPFNSAGTNLAISGYDIVYVRAASTDDFRLYVDLENAADPDIAVSKARCPVIAPGSYGSNTFVVCAD